MSTEEASGVALDDVRPPSVLSGFTQRWTVDWNTLARRWASLLVPPILYLLASFYYAQHFWTDPQHRVYGTDDAILFSWYFEWIKHCITTGQNPFITHAMAVPGGVNVMWNTAVLVLAFVFAPLTAIIGATATVGVLESLSPALAAIAAYFVLRRLTGRTLGAALGAALYGFGPFFVIHTAHLHLIFAVFPPLALLVGYQLFVRQDKSAIRTGLLFGALVGIQMLISEELVVLTALGALCALIAVVIVNPRGVRVRFRHSAIGVGVGAATALAITAVPLYYQFFGQYSLPKGFRGPPAAKADLAQMVWPSPLQYYATAASKYATTHFKTSENTAYLGWPLVIAALGYAIWLIIRRSRFGIWWLLTALGVAVLSLGSPIQVDGHKVVRGPWAVVRRLPLLDGALPVRLSLITLLLLAGLIAVAVANYRGWRQAIAAVVVVLALIPLRAYGPYRARVLPATPEFFTSSAVKVIPQGSDVLVMPYPSYPEARAMLWQIKADMRFNIVGGYSVFKLNGVGRYWPPYPAVAPILSHFYRERGPLTPQEKQAGLASLRSTNIRYIVITETFDQYPQVAQAATDLTGCTLQPVKDVLLCQVPPSESAPPAR